MEQHGFSIEGDYSDAIAQRAHLLSRVDVRVKLLASVAALGVAISAHGTALPLVMLAVGVILCLLMGVRPAPLAARLVAPFSIAAVLVAGQMFFWRGETLFTLPAGPWGALIATREGMDHGLLLAARVLGSVAVMVALGYSTPFQSLLAAAHWLRAPAIVVEIASLMYRYLFLLRDEASTMMQAQRVRLGYVGYRRSLRSAAAVCGMSFARAYDRASDIHRAMLSRGYTGEMRAGGLRPLGRRDYAQLLVCLAALAAAWVVDLEGLWRF